MRVRSDLPREVREVPHTTIKLADGCQLAARLWMPQDAEEHPVPAILEYLPYRKNDWTARRDAVMHRYFAGHGYASVRVDMRGTGDSEGILTDEYSELELVDALEIIEWIVSQPWCQGAVGMIGISWGGFNALQVAARQPTALKAIITVASTDDRYADDVHYMGGCLIGSDMLSWASTMFAYNARPPDPAVVGDRWREMWFDRMRKTPPFIETWISHQRRDDYWKHGSICEDYGDVKCAVYAVGGWADPYRNAIFRMLAGMPGPTKGLIGPWAHAYPFEAAPGPAIGFLQECLRWWGHWLKGEDTGVMEEPRLRAWMQEPVPPGPWHDENPGRWVAEKGWPSASMEASTWWLADGRLLDYEPVSEAEVHFLGPQETGLYAGTWCPHGDRADFVPDQRPEDGRSLTFDSAPLDERIEILGFPQLVFTFSVDRPNALVAVRLCDVAPGGESTLVTRAVFNLAHRESHENPEPLTPGERYTVRIALNSIGYSFPPRHRLRVAISPTYWPWAWPSPEPVTLTVATGWCSSFVLPVRVPQREDEALPEFEPPEGAPPPVMEQLPETPTERVIRHDVASGWTTMTWKDHSERRQWFVREGLEYEQAAQDVVEICTNDPLSARISCEWSIALRRQGWEARVETQSVMTADDEFFRVTNLLEGYEGNTRVFANTWTFACLRDLV